jgi:hypothetical protein
MGEEDYLFVTDVVKESDGAIWCGGSDWATNFYPWVMKCDLAGGVQWNFDFDKAFHGSIDWAQQTDDRTIYLIGNIKSRNKDADESYTEIQPGIFIAKLNIVKN